MGFNGVLLGITNDLDDEGGVDGAERVDGLAGVGARVVDADAGHLKAPAAAASVVVDLFAVLAVEQQQQQQQQQQELSWLALDEMVLSMTPLECQD